MCCKEISLFAMYTTWHVGFRLLFYASFIYKNSMPNYLIPHNIGVHLSYYLKLIYFLEERKRLLQLHIWKSCHHC